MPGTRRSTRPAQLRCGRRWRAPGWPRSAAPAGRFRTLEVWRGHACHATLAEAGANALRQPLARHGLPPVSYAGGLSGPEAEAMMRATRLLGIDLLAGGLPLERPPEIARLAR